jgi:formylglycine-generating enzyme required for sulfatase activity
VQSTLAVSGWPFNAAEAQRRQAAAGSIARRSIDLGGGVTLDLVLVPAGEFVLGDAEGSQDERPPARVRIDRPFWMGRCEVSNAQFARFDSSHDSRVESKSAYQFGIHGYPVNRPGQPVVRVSWQRAMEFCRWLSAATGEKFSLPTEAQWEYACRAGSATAFSYGTLDTDFSKAANLGDAKLRELASNPYTVDTPYPNATKYDDWVPKEVRFNDGQLLSAPVGSYAANAWGLHDMHGNVAEWTRSAFRPYPYREDDGRNNLSDAEDKVVRGGSWRDRPMRCGSAFRLAYKPYQAVFNVGFRVIMESDKPRAVAKAAAE